MTIRYLLLTVLMAVALSTGHAQTRGNANVLDLKHSIRDNSIVYPESFETDAQRMLEGWYMKNYTATDERYRNMGDTEVPDAEVKRRLAALPTVIDMPFNQIVRSYIDRYTRSSRAQVAVILGLSHYYMPIFEQALEERGLPLELKFLPIIESGLDPNAVSKHGATGLWQFMIGTAKGLGLEVNSLVDERRDPYVSSATAAGYLKDLYDTYGDWSLAIAAYNCGPGAVNKAIRRAGGDPKKHDFWSIYNYLTPETRGYVPMFIAINYVMTYYPQHNISPVLATKPLVTDTLQVTERIHFEQISKVLDIPVDELRILNPQFRADIIPGSAETSYTLVLPSRQVQAYLLSADAIRGYESEKYARRETAEPGEQVPSDVILADAAIAAEEMESKDNENVRSEMADAPTLSNEQRLRSVIHKVKAGETLASIAKDYQVTPQQIREGNGLRRNALRVGQQLRINTPTSLGKEVASKEVSAMVAAVAQSSAKPAAKQQPKAAAKQTKPAAASKPAAAPKPVSHTIKSGETLSTIARKYGVTVAQLKQANGLKSDAIAAGNTLSVPGAKTVAAAPAKSTAATGTKKTVARRSSSTGTKKAATATTAKKAAPAKKTTASAKKTTASAKKTTGTGTKKTSTAKKRKR